MGPRTARRRRKNHIRTTKVGHNPEASGFNAIIHSLKRRRRQFTRRSTGGGLILLGEPLESGSRSFFWMSLERRDIHLAAISSGERLLR